MNKSALSRRKLVGIVMGLLLAVSTSSVAGAKLPPLHPEKDVTVTYVGRDGRHVVVKTAAGGYPMRIEFPDQKDERGSRMDAGESYFVVLSPEPAYEQGDSWTRSNTNYFSVWDDKREFLYDTYKWDDWLGKLPLVSKNGGDMIAGIVCENWNLEGVGFEIHGQNVDRPDSVCISRDGVLLRFLKGADTFEPGAEPSWNDLFSNGYPASMIAQSVSFDPLPPEIFAVPKGYTQTHYGVAPSPVLRPPVVSN